jgi:hypothetical protein
MYLEKTEFQLKCALQLGRYIVEDEIRAFYAVESLKAVK